MYAALAANAGHPAIAALLGLGAAGLAGAVVAMAWTVHARQIRLAERLARRQFLVVADPGGAEQDGAIASGEPDGLANGAGPGARGNGALPSAGGAGPGARGNGPQPSAGSAGNAAGSAGNGGAGHRSPGHGSAGHGSAGHGSAARGSAARGSAGHGSSVQAGTLQAGPGQPGSGRMAAGRPAAEPAGHPGAGQTGPGQSPPVVIEGPDTVVAGDQARYRVRPSGSRKVVAWAAGGGSVSQAPDPAHPDELLLIADQPGSLTLIVRVRDGMTERRGTKTVTAVPEVPAPVPFTLRLFLNGWGLVTVTVLIAGFAAALDALGNLSSSDFIALVSPLAALLSVVAVARGRGDAPAPPSPGKGTDRVAAHAARAAEPVLPGPPHAVEVAVHNQPAL
jgi:hypothetical protein